VGDGTEDEDGEDGGYGMGAELGEEERKVFDSVREEKDLIDLETEGEGGGADEEGERGERKRGEVREERKKGKKGKEEEVEFELELTGSWDASKRWVRELYISPLCPNQDTQSNDPSQLLNQVPLHSLSFE